jgi:hypothetical protein
VTLTAGGRCGRGQITEDTDDIAVVTVMWETLKAAGVNSGELGLS